MDQKQIWLYLRDKAYLNKNFKVLAVNFLVDDIL